MAEGEDDRRQLLTVWLPPSLLAGVKRLAKRERRTQTSIIELALARYLERQGESGLPDELKQAVKEHLERHQQPAS